MRKLLVLALVLGLASVAFGYDTGNQLPPKATPVVPVNVPNPDRQGGDTVLNATLISALPYNDSGTTAGYFDDYDEICPYSNSYSPDVVYRFTPAGNTSIKVDLCGSDYDTKTYVYTAGLALVACNDDFYYDATCGYYTSMLENVNLVGGNLYYIIIDGYGGDFGNYVLEVTEFVPCTLTCPAGGFPEGEPPLVNNYVDNWNGGCNTSPGYPFQELLADPAGNQVLCGVSGWYLFGTSNYRDTDWFHVYAGPTGIIEVTWDAEYATYHFELAGTCGAVSVVQSGTAGPCNEASMTYTYHAPGAQVWAWFGPTVFADPDGGDNMYDYIAWFSGLQPNVATTAETWGGVKALFE